MNFYALFGVREDISQNLLAALLFVQFPFLQKFPFRGVYMYIPMLNITGNILQGFGFTVRARAYIILHSIFAHENIPLLGSAKL